MSVVQATFGGWVEGSMSGLAMVERLSGTATYYRSHSSPDREVGFRAKGGPKWDG